MAESVSLSNLDYDCEADQEVNLSAVKRPEGEVSVREAVLDTLHVRTRERL